MTNGELRRGDAEEADVGVGDAAGGALVLGEPVRAAEATGMPAVSSLFDTTSSSWFQSLTGIQERDKAESRSFVVYGTTRFYVS
jgi:hypothetical protein